MEKTASAMASRYSITEINDREALKGVSRTLLLPVITRYCETMRKDGFINDPYSVKILEQLGIQPSARWTSGKKAYLAPFRTEIIDEFVVRYLQEKPGSTVVNLGCGLDARFHRLDDGRVRWYDLDLPDAISLKRKFFGETDRYKLLAKSMFDYSWMDAVDRTDNVLFIAEGLLFYFTPEEVRGLLKKTESKFPDADLLIDAISSFADIFSRINRLGITGVKWHIEDRAELDLWFDRSVVKAEWYFWDRHRDRLPAKQRLLTMLPRYRKANRIIHVKL